MSADDVDPSKGVWRVRGKLPEPDGRTITIFVNAESEPEAIENARKKETFDTVQQVSFHTPEEIKRWEALAPPIGKQ